MRRLVLTAMVLAVALSGVELFAQASSATEKSLEAKEQAGWQAWKEHNAEPIKDTVPENSIDIADGTVTKGTQQILHGIASHDCTVNSFSLSSFSYMWLDKDTVLMTYTATQDATCSGKKQAGKVIASSLWQKKAGKWVSPFHQETEVPGT